MADTMTYPFTPERVREQSVHNLHAFILGGLAVAKAEGRDGAAWARALGKILAAGWTEIATPQEAAAAIALNCESTGLQIISVSGDESCGEVVTGDWPDATELFAFFSLTQAEADQVWQAFDPIVKALGYTFVWRREGELMRFTVSR